MILTGVWLRMPLLPYLRYASCCRMYVAPTQLASQTGNEASVDRLMKQITSFMSEISDELKVVVVDAVRSLCLKFASKQASILTFLSGTLRDEGNYDFKRAVVEAIFDMIKFIPDCVETALSHLCEFIGDCEYTKLSVRILHLLGVQGPKATNSSDSSTTGLFWRMRSLGPPRYRAWPSLELTEIRRRKGVWEYC
jgi:hypothetical protein